MPKPISFVLDTHSDKFVRKEVASGRYASVAEVVKSALQLLQDDSLQIKRLRNEIELGEKSGMLTDFDPESHLERLHQKYLNH